MECLFFLKLLERGFLACFLERADFWSRGVSAEGASGRESDRLRLGPIVGGLSAGEWLEASVESAVEGASGEKQGTSGEKQGASAEKKEGASAVSAAFSPCVFSGWATSGLVLASESPS